MMFQMLTMVTLRERNKMEQDKVSKLSDVGKNVWAEDGERSKKVEQEQNVSYRQRWDKARASKKVVFWAVLGAIVLTMIVGFNWGGWVTGGTAQKMGVAMAQDAVVQRLAPICVLQFNQDPDKAQKLIGFKEART
jgi:predicted phage tail protein